MRGWVPDLKSLGFHWLNDLPKRHFRVLGSGVEGSGLSDVVAGPLYTR